jgi:hypothetical protein
MVMITSQQAGLLVQEPASHLKPATLRTHPVTTGIVPDPFQMPFRTGLHMTTEKRGATRQDCLNRTTNISRQWMMTFIHVITLLQNAL